MSNSHSAEVFNQSGADFMCAAERAEYDGPESVQEMKYFMEAQAPGLYYYIGRYMQDIVTPFNRDPQTKVIDEHARQNTISFASAAFITFKMVDGVYRDTGVELPDFSADNLEAADPADVEFVSNPHQRVIDIMYRGAELRDRLPHIFRPSLRVMQELVELPVEQLEKDLSTPLTEHDNFHVAFVELHFIGGAAEVILAIEEHAAKEAV